MFNWDILGTDDRMLAQRIMGRIRPPDLTIAPDATDYLYRWHIVREQIASIYLHVQVASDPQRPRHDHPWDNQSVILSGCYKEYLQPVPGGLVEEHWRMRGDVVTRKAEWAHRLILPNGFAYTMTLFSTGPIKRRWGFWFEDGWRAFEEVTELLPDNRSVMREEYRN